MTKYEVLVSREALQFLRDLPRDTCERVRTRLELLAEDPFRARPKCDIKRLRGGDDPPLFRLRAGDYRALYFVAGRTVKVTEVLHRSKAYRGMD